ncbi:MHO_1590 family protein [Mycoplasmopsis cricetuli]|uniref:MHO_1590 family protein n=1 Tax=Mycoplasmopsis cricetuli TaxID=171283 RepID=UPI0012EBA601|nr:hypothetical protein [Mycoplasmopsis cricetuli]
MTKWKIKLILVLGGSILATIGIYYGYKYFFQKNKILNVSQKPNLPTENEKNIFPKFDENYFQNLLTKENKTIFLNENLVYYFISDLAKRIRISDGEIKYSWKQVSSDELHIFVEVKTKNNLYKKGYKFLLEYNES